MTDQERRRAIRRQCDNHWIDVVIQNAHNPSACGPELKVRVENICDTGMCLISSSPFELGQVLSFSADDLPCQGTVVWTCQSKVECKAGVQFS
nr:PilZ domain-containing protein [Desulfobulbaceae bacterium]